MNFSSWFIKVFIGVYWILKSWDVKNNMINLESLMLIHFFLTEKVTMKNIISRYMLLNY